MVSLSFLFEKKYKIRIEKTAIKIFLKARLNPFWMKC
jgi:hypothetical protein